MSVHKCKTLLLSRARRRAHVLPPPSLCRSRYGAALEDNPYPSGGGSHRGNIADFVMMLISGGSVLLAIAAYLNTPFMASSLLFMVIYVWSKRFPATEVTLYFFRMPGTYLPWALIAWSLATGDDPTMDLLGLAAGHLYYFLVDALPNSPGAMAGRKMLWTPNFMYRIFGVAPTHAPAAYVAGRGEAPAAPRAGPHGWGQGRRLAAD